MEYNKQTAEYKLSLSIKLKEAYETAQFFMDLGDTELERMWNIRIDDLRAEISEY